MWLLQAIWTCSKRVGWEFGLSVKVAQPVFPNCNAPWHLRGRLFERVEGRCVVQAFFELLWNVRISKLLGKNRVLGRC